MKNLILIFFLFLVASCGQSTSHSSNTVEDSDATYPDEASSSRMAGNKTPYVHWELLSPRGDDWVNNTLLRGNRVLHLTSNYKTDGTQAICVNNLAHSAAVANGSSDTNYVAYPYVVYRMLTDNKGVKRFNTWMYISMDGLPASEKDSIIKWMYQTKVAYLPAAVKIDSTENVACYYKLKGFSTDWQQ